MDEHAQVSELLREAARSEDVRLSMMSTLSTADIWQIWSRTGHRSTGRDKRTNRMAGAELRRRGLLGASQHEASQQRPSQRAAQRAAQAQQPSGGKRSSQTA
jgi:hypothetical protein